VDLADLAAKIVGESKFLLVCAIIGFLAAPGVWYYNRSDEDRAQGRAPGFEVYGLGLVGGAVAGVVLKLMWESS
jgi:hypothetical protein